MRTNSDSIGFKSSLTSFLILSALAFALVSFTIYIVGESPILVFQILFNASFGSWDAFTYTLFYATPLLFTGLAVSIPLQAGLFNIGAEGQLYIGSLAAASWGLFLDRWLPAGSAAPVAILLIFWIFGAAFSFLAGACWGALAGYLRTYRNTHEVIATIMLNFIALAFSNWMILYPLKNLDTQNVESRWIPEALRLPPLFGHATYGLPLAISLCVLSIFAVKKTWWGYRVRASGSNPNAAYLAGIKVPQTLLSSLFIGGGFAGLVGFNEVFAHSHRLIDGFSPQYGFTGIAIALLAGARALPLIMTALFFGALHKGTLDLDLETEKITRDLSYIIQALVLLVLAAKPAILRKVRTWME